MHPTCQHILPLLQLYIDDELAELESEDVENHIEICTNCAETLAEEFAMRQALRDGLEGDCTAPQQLKENLQAWLSLQSVREDAVANDAPPAMDYLSVAEKEGLVSSGPSMPFRGMAIGGLMVAAAALWLFLLPPASQREHSSDAPVVLAPQPERPLRGVEASTLDLRPSERMNLVRHRKPSRAPLRLRPYRALEKSSSVVSTSYRRKETVSRPTRLHHDSAKPQLRVVREWQPASSPINLVHFPLSH